VLDERGISPDPEKTKAIRQMHPPGNVSELRRFLGVVNQFGKLSHRLASLSQPLRELLKKNNSWIWGQQQASVFTDIKSEIAKNVVLDHYDLEAETKLATDASSYGLGAVLLQRQSHTSDWRPVTFASRSLTETERHYAQIEKEALAVTWACDKFASYLLGKPFLIHTDHKPLIPLLGSKQLDNLPPQILRFRLRLTRFQYSIEHTQGKTLYIPDTLSRAPLPAAKEDIYLPEQAEGLMEVAIANLPASSKTLVKYSEQQLKDPVCSTLIWYCKKGWPKYKSRLSSVIQPYWEHQGNLTLANGLLLYDHRIVIPQSIQKESLEKIHLRIKKCRSQQEGQFGGQDFQRRLLQK
jgi:hypothetical protein